VGDPGFKERIIFGGERFDVIEIAIAAVGC